MSAPATRPDPNRGGPEGEAPDAYPPPVKRSLTLSGHRTSVSLEEPFWQEFRRLAAAGGFSVNALANRIDGARGTGTTLASAIRLHVLAAVREGR